MTITTIFRILLALHIGAGTVALFVGPGAMFTKKGAAWHRFWGKVYVYAMGVVAVTALPMGAIHPSPFLQAVAVFSFYLAFSGWRLLRRKNTEATLTRARLADALPAALMLGASGYLLYNGGRVLIGGNAFGTVLLVFGALGGGLALNEIIAIYQPITDPKKRIPGHIGRMCGAYIATLTAFSAVNLTFLPAVFVWLWPTALGAPLIAYMVRRYRAKPRLP